MKTTVMKRGMAALGMMIAILLAAAPSASAVSDLSVRFYGLLVNDQGRYVGEIDTTTSTNNLNRRIVSDSLGDRQQIQAPVRDRDFLDGRPAYSRVSWWGNGTFCYLAGISVTARGGGLSTECTNGWYPRGTTSVTAGGGGFWFTTHRSFRNGSIGSMAGDLQVCADSVLWLPDPCSGIRSLGVDFN